ELNIPAVILSKTAYEKHIRAVNSLSSISLQLDFVDIQSETENVYAFINHNSDKTIILSSSYDYLGSYYDQSLPYGNNKIVNYGADKNASGVAGVLALVDMLQMKKDLGNDYNYLIAFYSASQLGHQGVNHFLKYLPNIMKQQVVAAIHLDHIGRYQQDKGLYVMGSNHSGMNEQLANRSTSSRLHFNIGGSISKDSDAYFYEKDHIPTLQFHTGNITDHGTPADHPSKINYLNIWNIVFSIYQGIFSAEPSLQKLSNKTSTTDKNVNYTKTPVKWEEWGIQIDKNYEGLGVKLLSLSNDGLAKRIKLEEGDIVFNINKKPVVTLEDLESVLKTITYDEEITIKIKRDVSVLDINTKI
ncbi:MAG TPA: M28 family peptidase, partial [Chitinophagaceae bacterium]|nr:M28 family peptidase [Chitinophagaceae bacterium]